MTVARSNNSFVNKDGWLRCVNCGHKLGKVLENKNHNECSVEIKCHSCKTINVCFVNKRKE